MSHDVSLYELVTKATQADIDVIDNEITLLVCERDAIEAKITRLKQLRDLFCVMVHGEQAKPRRVRPRKVKAAQETKPPLDPALAASPLAAVPAVAEVLQPPTQADHDNRTQMIAVYLANHGESKASVMSDALNIPLGSMGYYLSKPLFARNRLGDIKGYVLTQAGREYLRQQQL